MSEGLGETARFDSSETGVTIEVRSPDGAVVTMMRLSDDIKAEDACSAARQAVASLAKARARSTGRKPPPTGGDLFWSWALPQG